MSIFRVVKKTLITGEFTIVTGKPIYSPTESEIIEVSSGNKAETTETTVAESNEDAPMRVRPVEPTYSFNPRTGAKRSGGMRSEDE